MSAESPRPAADGAETDERFVKRLQRTRRELIAECEELRESALASRRDRPAQRGDEAELFERYGNELVRIVRSAITAPRQIVEDACSFAWLQLLELQPERDAIVGWLRVVATNEAMRLLKHQARHTVFDEDPVELGTMRVGARIELTVEAREALEHIAALTPQQIRIFSLHVAGLTYDEICAATGYSPRQVDRHMVRARSRLRARRKGRDRSTVRRSAVGG